MPRYSLCLHSVSLYISFFSTEQLPHSFVAAAAIAHRDFHHSDQATIQPSREIAYWVKSLLLLIPFIVTGLAFLAGIANTFLDLLLVVVSC